MFKKLLLEYNFLNHIDILQKHYIITSRDIVCILLYDISNDITETFNMHIWYTMYSYVIMTLITNIA